MTEKQFKKWRRGATVVYRKDDGIKKEVFFRDGKEILTWEGPDGELTIFEDIVITKPILVHDKLGRPLASF